MSLAPDGGTAAKVLLCKLCAIKKLILVKIRSCPKRIQKSENFWKIKIRKKSSARY